MIAGIVLGAMILLILLIILIMFLARRGYFKSNKKEVEAIAMPAFGLMDDSAANNDLYGPLGGDVLYRDFRRAVSFDNLRYNHQLLKLNDQQLVYMYRILRMQVPISDHFGPMRSQCANLLSTMVEPRSNARQIVDAVDFIGAALADVLVEIAIDFSVSRGKGTNKEEIYESFYACIDEGGFDEIYEDPSVAAALYETLRRRVQKPLDPIYDDAVHKDAVYDMSNARDEHVYSMSNERKKKESPYYMAGGAHDDPTYSLGHSDEYTEASTDPEPAYDISDNNHTTFRGRDAVYDIGQGKRDPLYDSGHNNDSDEEAMYDIGDSSGTHSPKKHVATYGLAKSHGEPTYDISDGASAAHHQKKKNNNYDMAKSRGEPTYDISDGASVRGPQTKKTLYNDYDMAKSRDAPTYDISEGGHGRGLTEPTYEHARQDSKRYTKTGAQLVFDTDDIYDNSGDLGDDADDVYYEANVMERKRSLIKKDTPPVYARASEKNAEPTYLMANRTDDVSYDVGASNTYSDPAYSLAANETSLDTEKLVPSAPGSSRRASRRKSASFDV